MKVFVPIRLPSLSNTRWHWAKLHAVKAKQKRDVVICLRCDSVGESERPPLPATVVITRIGKRLLDRDNLASSIKAVQDAIAEWYGVDDGSKLYTWKYQQRVGKEYGVEIEITSSPANPGEP